MEKGIVLFDGVCNFCDSSVQFIMKRDVHKHFQFASIQSEIGQQLIQKYNLQQLDSLVVIENGYAYTKSNAALEIAKHFRGGWKLVLLVKIFPTFLRDAAYDIFARNRYKWFGQKEVCRIPTKEERERFLS